MRVKFLAQGNNQSLWWDSNLHLTGQSTETITTETSLHIADQLVFKNILGLSVYVMGQFSKQYSLVWWVFQPTRFVCREVSVYCEGSLYWSVGHNFCLNLLHTIHRVYWLGWNKDTNSIYSSDIFLRRPHSKPTKSGFNSKSF